MSLRQYQQMKEGRGFVAALDQSGGSTPRALSLYGISEDKYASEEEMFDLVHEMRSRIITDKAFDSTKVLAAILFEQTMDRTIEGQLSADYLWRKKGIVPILKVDQGLEKEENGVQLMKPLDRLDALLERAKERHIWGTKMRSVIKKADKEGIRAIVKQQFDVGRKIQARGLVPILEPEVDIHAKDRKKIEEILREEILEELKSIPESQPLMFKLTLPVEPDYYREIIEHPSVLRVVALSGGFTREEANEQLVKNRGLIASFSRALTEGLAKDQTDEEFSRMLEESINSIYEASIT
jgi:fructose-bisphosphate aldolase class I